MHEVNQQVLQTFEEEVRAALPTLKRHLTRLAKQPERRDTAEKAHKLLQGLSGTASLLGLAVWSESGSLVESALAEIITGSENLTADTARELRSAIDSVEGELAALGSLEPLVIVAGVMLVVVEPAAPVDTAAVVIA